MHILFQRELMNQNRFWKPVAIAAGLFFLCTAAGLSRAQSSSPSAVQTRKADTPEVQQKKDALPADDFAGLQYTDEQKAEIGKILQELKSRREAVIKAEKLTADQKDAMLSGYTRIEYGEIFKVLTPDQQREVQKKARARKAAALAAAKGKS